MTGLGIVLLLPYLRRLFQIGVALERFSHGDAGKRISVRFFDPLKKLVEIVNRVTGAGQSHELREQLEMGIEQTAAQQERNRLARELHDSIKQQLFSIQMSAAAAEKRLTLSAEDAGGSLDAIRDARQSAQEALVEMNALLAQLSPAPLEKVGLAQALRDQCEALGYRSGAQVTCEIGELPTEKWLVTGVQEALFRIAQEALSNVSRHARAGQVHLSLDWNHAASVLELAISDDGLGFDPAGEPQGRGLAGMRTRVESLGGQIEIDSAPGQGTHLQVRFPVYAEEEAIAITADHAPNRVGLVSLGGGVLAALLLAVPWILHIPQLGLSGGNLLDRMPDGVAYLLAAMVALLSGWLAARWVRHNGILAGGAAGLLAGLVTYGLVGGAWAGVRGSQALLANGWNSLPENAVTGQLMESTGHIFLWTGGLYIVILLAGACLGALGGLIACGRQEITLPVDWRATCNLLAAPVVISSAGAILLAGFFMPLIEGASLNLPYDILGTIPVNLISVACLVPLVIPTIFYIAGVAWQYKALQAEFEQKSLSGLPALHWQTLTWTTLYLLVGAIALLVSFGFLTRAGSSEVPATLLIALYPLAATGIFSLVMTTLYGVQLGKIRQRMLQNHQPVPSLVMYAGLIILPVSLVFTYLTLLDSQWLVAAFLSWLVEMICLAYLLIARHLPTGTAGRALRRSARENTARLSGSWLLVSLLFLLPALDLGAAGLSLLSIPARMTPNGLEDLTQKSILGQHYLVLAGTFVGLLVIAFGLTGFRQILNALAGLRIRKEL